MRKYLCFFILLSLSLLSNVIANDDLQLSDVNLDFERSIERVNHELELLRAELKQKYDQGYTLYEKKGDEESYLTLLQEIREIKDKISSTEVEWRGAFVEDSTKKDGSYAFWDQGETTLSQLIMEYGATDYLYVIPQELGSLKMQMYSTLPIPHESWEEMVELILVHNGIGIKKLTPYLRELFFLKHDPGYIEAIVQSKEQLMCLSPCTNVFYIFSPDIERIKEVRNFFERFCDLKQTTVQIVGNKLVLISTKDSLEKLLQLYEAVWDQKQNKAVRILYLTKIGAERGKLVLESFFQGLASQPKPSFYSSVEDELSILAEGSSLILIGSSELIARAEKVIQDVEAQLEDPAQMTVFWYTCKHTDPDDIAKILEQVYSSLGLSSVGEKDVKCDKEACQNVQVVNNETLERSLVPYSPVLPVKPEMVSPGVIDSKKEQIAYGNFIVDAKSGSLLMVVRKDVLPKIKALLKKLDVPKKMAQIDVLLVEKKLQDRTQSGINLLKIGTSKHTRKSGSSFDTAINAPRKGILDFIISRSRRKHFPNIDFTMSFLMAQDDVHINANPSVIAINQTPATISIVEELSINNGAVQIGTVSGITVEKAYTRAQFGITIVMTPTIHLPDYEADTEDPGFVTLKTNVTFDTIQASDDDRPPATRRHLENEVRVADGETIILGGLRKKGDVDSREKIPFLGDIPKFGKLFGTTKFVDTTTEMFIFITPHIIHDPVEDLRLRRQEFLIKRPGDVPAFLKKVEKAREKERKCMFANSIRLLFDRDSEE